MKKLKSVFAFLKAFFLGMDIEPVDEELAEFRKRVKELDENEFQGRD